MRFEKIDIEKIPFNSIVRVKDMGNVIEIMYSNNRNNKCSIKKLDANRYVDLVSGEIKEFVHIENRSNDIGSVRQSLGRLRDYLNTNITDVSHCRWVTLTYAENMTDTERLYNDFRKFNMRLKYKYGKYEYIVAMEPQGRGAWHCHVVLIFDRAAPFIPNDELAKIWGHGFVKVTALDNVDNVGAYLTAYLGDMEVSEIEKSEVYNAVLSSNKGIKEVNGKRYVKGARLYLYPPKFNLYRCSRGIKKPDIYYDIEKNAQKKVSAATLTFERSIQLVDELNDFSKIINYRYYNLKKNKNQ